MNKEYLEKVRKIETGADLLKFKNNYSHISGDGIMDLISSVYIDNIDVEQHGQDYQLFDYINAFIVNKELHDDLLKFTDETVIYINDLNLNIWLLYNGGSWEQYKINITI